MYQLLRFLVLFVISFGASAALDPALETRLSSKIEQQTRLQVLAIKPAALPGIYLVETNAGLLYISADGKYLVQGTVYNLDAGLRNETEESLKSIRIATMQSLAESSIEYKAKDEKYVVSVFTDITCGYCRKLHREMSQLNELGITVRYLAFPRQGLNTQNHKDMDAVWCANNPQQAMNNAKAGQSIAASSCDSPVQSHYLAGQKLGINSTPNIILADGSLVRGYQPAQALAAQLAKLAQASR